jgi:Zn-dependent peptidase ImmA (M78 family)
MKSFSSKKNTVDENASPAANGNPVQCKLTMGATNDKYEQEANAVADKVIHAPDQSFVQRKPDHNGDEEEKIQAKPLVDAVSSVNQAQTGANSVASKSISSKISSSRGTGSSMDSSTRSFMNNRFGVDFNEIKIHSDSAAIQMSRELNAKAFTVGSDIFFNESKYQPGSAEGKHLLAHELTHVLQQGRNNSHVQRTAEESNTGGDKDQQEKDLCEGWERDLESLTINAARFHFKTEHSEDIQVEKTECGLFTSAKMKVCDLTLTDGREVTVFYNAENNILRVQHTDAGVIKFCRYNYSCTAEGSVVYRKIDCNE